MAAQAAGPSLPAKGPASAAGISAKHRADPLKGLRGKHDEMRGITWYKHPSSGDSGNAFYLYFGRRDDGTLLPLRLLLRYYGDSWLFVEKAWAKADGVEVIVPQVRDKYRGWERDNGGGSIWEWSDTAVTEASDLSSVRQLANAKAVTVRFEGRQYYGDRKLSPQQLKAMREVLDAYKAAGGSVPF
jgi:hypothetical protein